jgi:M6 family metalloprotease-like protein
MATPFIDQTFTFTQPDGTKLEVRGSGNQYFARFETLDGYTVTRDADSGFWEIARLSHDSSRLEPVPGARAAADGGRSQVSPGLALAAAHMRARVQDSPIRPGGRRWEQRRAHKQQLKRAARSGVPAVAAPPQRTTVGDYFGLCLLIDFKDEPAQIPQSEIDSFCNQQGYSGFGNNGSVYDYFFDNSLGRLRYKNVVMPYYRAQFSKSHYTDPSVEYGARARELVVEALEHWKAAGFDFSQLTPDEAGQVYATNVFYAGTRVNDWSQGLWPHAWYVDPSVPLAPGRAAHDYQITDIGTALELGTFCHENGHMLCDYPDLYDYDQGPTGSGGIGAFCLMCLGGNIEPRNPAHISAYLKRISGWASDIKELKPGKRVVLCAGNNEFAIHQKNATEYFLIENRVKEDRDVSLPDAGLAIWHVDELGNNSLNEMTEASHYELSLEQADGLFELEKNLDAWGDGEDLFARRGRFSDTTTPSSKWWDGTSSHLTIDRIAIGKGKAVFRSTITKPRSTQEASDSAVDAAGAE